jgi:hypothetical protein
MGDKVTIISKGRFNDTVVELGAVGTQEGAYTVPGGDLQKVQVYWEPGCDQVACEVKFVHEGRIKRWSGVNEDDDFVFELNATDENGTAYVVRAGKSSIDLWVNGAKAFADCPKVVEIVADGWAIQLNRYFDMKKEG